MALVGIKLGLGKWRTAEGSALMTKRWCFAVHGLGRRKGRMESVYRDGGDAASRCED